MIVKGFSFQLFSYVQLRERFKVDKRTFVFEYETELKLSYVQIMNL